MKAIIYLRVSTEEQAEKGFSIQGQREECTRKASEQGCTETLEFCDEGVSGSVLERPELIAAFNRMDEGDISYFVCYDCSRLSRNVSHQLIIVDEIKKQKVQLVFVKNTYEDSPEGRFQLTVMSAVDEYERARLRFRCELGKRIKANQGKLTHSPGLYGYDFDKDTDTLHINDGEARIIRMMYHMLTIDGIGPHSIAARLNDMGIPSPKNKLWQKTTVKRILNNTAYRGTLFIRRYDSKDVKLNKYKPPEERVSVKERPREEWVPVAVNGIIDEEVWDEAQDILANARRLWRSCSKADYLLSTLIRCGKCGLTVHGNLITNRNKKHRYYVCTGRSPGVDGKEKCSLGFINADQLEEIIWNKIAAWLNKPEELEKEIQDGLPDDLEEKQKRLEELDKELDKLVKEKERAATMFQKGLIDELSVEKRLKEINARSSTLKQLQQFLSNEINSGGLSSRELSEIKEIAGVVANTLDKLEFKDRYEIVRSLIEAVIITDETVIIKAKIPVLVENEEI